MWVAYPSEAPEFTLSFSGVRVARSLVLCVCFVDRCLSFFFWPLCCLSFCLLTIVLSVLLSFGHCVVCSSVFWPLCCLSFCLLTIVLSVLLSFDHCVVCSSVFWPLCCLFFFELRLLITSLWQLQTFPDILGANLYSLKWFNFYFFLIFLIYITGRNNSFKLFLTFQSG